MLSTSAEHTRRLGAGLVGQLKAGDVVLLSGSLGAGKSELARGIAMGLGVTAPVTSPTFTILNVYQTDAGFPLHHFDWYRINDPEELLAAGLDEFIGGDCLTLIEWHERAEELVPEKHLLIQLDYLPGGHRDILVRPMGGFRPIRFAAMPGTEE